MKNRIFVIVRLLLIAIVARPINGDLSSDIKELQKTVNLLQQYRDASSKYCQTHANGRCGSCLCKDESNLPSKHYCDCRNQTPLLRDCLELRQKGHKIDGIYRITTLNKQIIQVYCDQNGNGGGWTVIQRRIDGSENFYRNWQWYKRGFGQLQREFWLGNENIYLLTSPEFYPKGSKAWITVQPRGSSGHWNSFYSKFQVYSERFKYRLQVSSPSGSYASYLTSYSISQLYFSTYDRDNDGSSSYNCARSYNFAGWWFSGYGNSCSSGQAYTNLNGPYDKYNQRSWYKRFVWGSTSLASSEIKVRRLT